MLYRRNPMLDMDEADLEEARVVIRLWGWMRGTSHVKGMAAGSFGLLPGVGGVGDQPAALMDAFEELQALDFEEQERG